ncbi:antitoxin [Xanthobacter autotrophicus]|uniref:antitoxin n=1 Tax=Xanthobacter autotrophicus TaxID=280 RepID=UPI00372B3876
MLVEEHDRCQRQRGAITSKTAKIVSIGRWQSIMLPAEFHFEGSEVFVRRDPKTGDVILSPKPDSWEGLFQLYDRDQVADDFMGSADRSRPSRGRDPFAGWKE